MRKSISQARIGGSYWGSYWGISQARIGVTRECRSVGTLRLSDVFEAVADIIRSSCYC
ncbi:MAG: hypothetical protein QNJ97_12770 [Myxococcota bacterium]|nr:hypothetical protein [Myxococcota bacterium]